MTSEDISNAEFESFQRLVCNFSFRKQGDEEGKTWSLAPMIDWLVNQTCRSHLTETAVCAHFILGALVQENCSSADVPMHGLSNNQQQLHDTAKWSGKKSSLKSKRATSTAPNYFIAVPVSNPAIRESAMLIQNSILDVESDFRSAMVSVAKLHVTLMVMRLEDEKAVAR